jgi:hypothetical protein
MSGKIGPGGLLFPPSGHPVRTRFARGGSRPCFTLALAAKVDLKVVQDMLGHSGIWC